MAQIVHFFAGIADHHEEIDIDADLPARFDGAINLIDLRPFLHGVQHFLRSAFRAEIYLLAADVLEAPFRIGTSTRLTPAQALKRDGG